MKELLKLELPPESALLNGRPFSIAVLDARRLGILDPYDGTFFVFDVQARREVHRIAFRPTASAPTHVVAPCLLTKVGRDLLIYDSTCQQLIWTDSLRILRRVHSPLLVAGMAGVAGGRIAVTGLYQRRLLHVLSAHGEVERSLIEVLEGDRPSILDYVENLDVCVGPSGDEVFALSDRAAGIIDKWDVRTGRLTHRFVSASREYRPAAQSGGTASGTADGRILPSLAVDFPWWPEQFISLSVAQGTLVALSGSKKMVAILDQDLRPQSIRKLPPHRREITDCLLDAQLMGDSWIFSCADGAILVARDRELDDVRDWREFVDSTLPHKRILGHPLGPLGLPIEMSAEDLVANEALWRQLEPGSYEFTVTLDELGFPTAGKEQKMLASRPNKAPKRLLQALMNAEYSPRMASTARRKLDLHVLVHISPWSCRLIQEAGGVIRTWQKAERS